MDNRFEEPHIGGPSKLDCTDPGSSTEEDLPQPKLTLITASSNIDIAKDVIADVAEDVAEDVDELVSLLEVESKARIREDTVAVTWGVSYACLMVVLARLAAQNPSVYFPLLELGFISLGFAGLVIAAVLGSRSRRARFALLEPLGRSSNHEQIPSLVKALRVKNRWVRNAVTRALMRLLPELQASESDLLGPRERHALLREIQISPRDFSRRDLVEILSRSAYEREFRLRLAILKAYEQIGGGQELPTVERLSRDEFPFRYPFDDPSNHGPRKMPREIVDAAKNCLPFLQSRAQEQRAQLELLRASPSYEEGRSTLLRMVDVDSEVLSEELLRPMSDSQAPED